MKHAKFALIEHLSETSNVRHPQTTAQTIRFLDQIKSSIITFVFRMRVNSLKKFIIL